MNITEREEKIIDRISEIRFLKKGIEEIEEYENLIQELLESNNVACIPKMCCVMEDKAMSCSTVEQMLEAILILVQNAENTEEGIEKILEGTKEMKNHAEDWARILHIQILNNEALLDSYINCVKEANEIEKKSVLDILNQIKVRGSLEEKKVNKIIERIIS